MSRGDVRRRGSSLGAVDRRQRRMGVPTSGHHGNLETVSSHHIPEARSSSSVDLPRSNRKRTRASENIFSDAPHVLNVTTPLRPPPTPPVNPNAVVSGPPVGMEETVSRESKDLPIQDSREEKVESAKRDPSERPPREEEAEKLEAQKHESAG
mmetsp:Transcript_5906/g.9062  ORF Transcript_5906/g.9062 Transcript_5906/m.9062 type:complete len:153 (-) Transcript_5906:100-558(-)